jgi:hypothetical protein
MFKTTNRQVTCLYLTDLLSWSNHGSAIKKWLSKHTPFSRTGNRLLSLSLTLSRASLELLSQRFNIEMVDNFSMIKTIIHSKAESLNC